MWGAVAPWGRGEQGLGGRGRDADVGGGARGRVQVSRATAPFVPPPPASPHKSPLGASLALAPRARRTAAGGVFGPGQVRLGSILGSCAGHLWRPQEQRFCRPARPRAGERVRGQLHARPCWGEGIGVGWAAPLLPVPRNPTPHLSLRSDPSHPGPHRVLRDPPTTAASLLPSLVSLPIPSPLSRLLRPSSHFSILCPGPRLLPPPPLLPSLLPPPTPPPFSIPTSHPTFLPVPQPQTSLLSHSFCPPSLPLYPPAASSFSHCLCCWEGV